MGCDLGVFLWKYFDYVRKDWTVAQEKICNCSKFPKISSLCYIFPSTFLDSQLLSISSYTFLKNLLFLFVFRIFLSFYLENIDRLRRYLDLQNK